MKRVVIALIVSIVLPSFASALATYPTRLQSPRIEEKPTNCETHIAILDIANQEAEAKGLIIMIGRLGDGERSSRLNTRRLYSAKAYLTDYRAVRSNDTVITAEGEPVKGYGQIEIYVHGRLQSAFALTRNAELSVGSCEPEALDTPEQRALRIK